MHPYFKYGGGGLQKAITFLFESSCCEVFRAGVGIARDQRVDWLFEGIFVSI